MIMARPPLGSALIDSLEGSDQARNWMRWILDTNAGRATVVEAASDLGVSPQYFQKRRLQALAAALTSLEPQPLGRPAVQPTVDERIAEIKAEHDRQAKDLEIRLRISQLREELLAGGLGHRLTNLSRKGQEKKRPTPT
jgi:hypothetical protein